MLGNTDDLCASSLDSTWKMESWKRGTVEGIWASSFRTACELSASLASVSRRVMNTLPQIVLISSMMRVSAGRRTSLTRWKGGREGRTIDDVVEENVAVKGFECVFLGKKVEKEENFLDEGVRKIGLRGSVRGSHGVVDELDDFLRESDGEGEKERDEQIIDDSIQLVIQFNW